MISGLHSIGNPGKYWDSLQGQEWIVVQPRFWQLWKRGNQSRLKSVFDHLLTTYNVKGGKFVLHGYSNGTSGVMDFACNYPELVYGIVIVAAIGIQPFDRLRKLSGIPIAQYWGDKDHTFHPCNLKLKRHLENCHHSPYHVLCIKGLDHEDTAGVLKRGGRLHGDVIGSIQNMFSQSSHPRAGGILKRSLSVIGKFAKRILPNPPNSRKCAICGSACKLGFQQVYGKWCCKEGTSCCAKYMDARRNYERRFNRNERQVKAACLKYIKNGGK